MKVITVTNVNEGLSRGLMYLKSDAELEGSRNGPVWVAPCPVTTVYLNPTQRVLFSAERDANPFFHLFEALWMLSGRNDVAYPHHYAPMMLYSDDAETLNGAYGYRWRSHFGYDQLEVIIAELRANPASRRCVLSMWDGTDHGVENANSVDYEGDLKRAISGGKDVPCNTHVYFRANDGLLDMTVCNRSNDAVWGAYGANAVHFSVLQEYIALNAGLGVGTYCQVANNFHVYAERPDVQRLMEASNKGGQPLNDDRYAAAPTLAPRVVPLVGPGDALKDFDADLERFMALPRSEPAPRDNWLTTFFFTVVAPMHRAHVLYKQDKLLAAQEQLDPRIDWHLAAKEWLERRIGRRAMKERAEQKA
jgi:Thymidylate synthase